MQLREAEIDDKHLVACFPFSFHKVRRFHVAMNVSAVVHSFYCIQHLYLHHVYSQHEYKQLECQQRSEILSFLFLERSQIFAYRYKLFRTQQHHLD